MRNNLTKIAIQLIFQLVVVFGFHVSPIFAQSGLGELNGVVSSGVKNQSVIAGAKVELRPIEAHNKSTEISTTKTDQNGEYKLEVSFGYYWLIISAKGYETYRTKAFIPSSNVLRWGTILEKIKIRN